MKAGMSHQDTSHSRPGHSLQHTTGWLLLTFGLLLATLYRHASIGVQVIAIGILLVAFWLILRSSQIFDISHSTQALLSEKPPSSTHAKTIHSTAFDALLNSVSFFAILTATLTIFLSLLGLGTLTITFLLLYMLAGVQRTVRREQWRHLIVLALGTYITLAIWLYPAPQFGEVLSRGVATVLLFAFTYIFSVPFILKVRRVKDRELTRYLLLLVYVSFTLLVLHETDNIHGARVLIQLAPAALAAGCGAVAWLGNRRRSYAKYFFTIALLVFLLVLIATVSLAPLIVVGLLIGSALITFGITRSSYSARVIGMGVLALAHLLYLSNLLQLLRHGITLPLQPQQTEIGLLFAISLPILAAAYGSTPALGDREARFRPLLVELLAITSIGMFALVAGVGYTGGMQTTIWALAALAGTLGGRRYHLSLVTGISVGMLSLALLKFVVLDLPLHIFH
jgi:hypothetical protein